LPGNHYVNIESHRYATTTDPIHAVTWGRLLFGPTTWAIVSRPQRSGELLYYVAGLSERLTEADLRVRPFDPKSRPIAGATGAYLGRVLPSLPGVMRSNPCTSPMEEEPPPHGKLLPASQAG